jgi:hypothetical protein
MKKLSKEFKETWIAALKSGKYQQTDAVLYEGVDEETKKPKMCCLGVACDLVGMDRNNLYNQGLPKGVIEDKNIENLPTCLREITVEDYESAKGLGKLAYFNDNGKSFKWIASYIERYL